MLVIENDERIAAAPGSDWDGQHGFKVLVALRGDVGVVLAS